MLMIVSSIFAESVIFNDGRILKGEIVGKKGDSIYLMSKGTIYLIIRNIVMQIRNDRNQSITKLIYHKKNFTNDGVDLIRAIQVVIGNKDGNSNMPVTYNMQKTHKTLLNLHTVGLGILFAGLAWDYFATAGNLSDTIKEYEELGASNKAIDKLEKEKTRKSFNGLLLSAASIFSFAVSVEKVEIKASPTSLELGFKF